MYIYKYLHIAMIRSETDLSCDWINKKYCNLNSNENKIFQLIFLNKILSKYKLHTIVNTKHIKTKRNQVIIAKLNHKYQKINGIIEMKKDNNNDDDTNCKPTTTKKLCQKNDE